MLDRAIGLIDWKWRPLFTWTVQSGLGVSAGEGMVSGRLQSGPPCCVGVAESSLRLESPIVSGPFPTGLC